MAEWSSNTVAGARPGSEDPAGPGAFEDAALLDRCRRGEMSAFGALITKYQDRLFNAILRMCGNSDDAEELSQEVFVKALENLGGFRRDSRLYTWLFRIAVNLTISRRRRGGRVKFCSLDAGGQEDDDSGRLRDVLPAGRADPAEKAGDRDTNRRVLEALANLDDEFRAVVVLRDVEGMNYEQIAEALNIPSGTVKSRLYRARCLLQKELRDLA